MTKPTIDNTIARWSRVGILFGARPSRRTPDLERLLLDTALVAPHYARLFTLSVTWLSQYDSFIARHRLKRLINDELEQEARPILGLILDLAIKHGATPTLNTAGKECGSFDEPRPLFEVHARSAARKHLAKTNSCPEAIRRGLWAPDVDLKLDALRPATWIIQNNPELVDRAVRKGDLRCTILETLRHDTQGEELDSELALVRLCAANRPAVSAALDDLECEGFRIRRTDPKDRRRYHIELHAHNEP
ncbi:MAG: hypothetical protein GC164_10240 [Phycisphaera sp.]|nr:hypothetical protein [Phycisphaera sp.]